MSCRNHPDRAIGSDLWALMSSRFMAAIKPGNLLRIFSPQETEVKRFVADTMKLCARAPQYYSGTVVTNSRQHVAFERVVFPLATDGEHVDMLIFVFAQRPR